MDVSYEVMVNDQEGMTRQILDFCGLGWEDACLEFYKSKRITRTASHDQVRQPMYRSSISRWKNYARYIGPLEKILDRA